MICQISEKTNEPTPQKWLDERMDRYVKRQPQLILYDPTGCCLI